MTLYFSHTACACAQRAIEAAENRARKAEELHARERLDGGDDDKTKVSRAFFKYIADAQAVELFEHTNDVQTRQCLVMDRALRDAWSAGYDWLLQLDIDELLYLPRAAERTDARAFFASVPRRYEHVAFHNHEVARRARTRAAALATTASARARSTERRWGAGRAGDAVRAARGGRLVR